MNNGYIAKSYFSDTIFRVLNALMSIGKNSRFKSNQKVDNNDLHFILFRIGALGDYTLCLDFFNKFIISYPESSITIVGGPALAPLAFLIPVRVQIITTSFVTSKKISDFFRFATLKELWRLKRQLNNSKKKNIFICALRLETVLGTLKCILFQKIAKPYETFGYNTIGRGSFYTYSIFDTGYLVKHERAYLNDMLLLVNNRYPTINNDYLLPAHIYSWDINKVSNSDFLKIVIHPGGGSNPNDIKWVNKRWDIDNYIRLINNLNNKFKIKIYLTGNEAERVIADEIQNNINDAISCINLAGRTSVKDIFEVLQTSHLFIGSDSGIAHIAGHVNIPCVIMFAYSDFIGYAPQGNNVTVLTAKLACVPCLYKFANRECLNTNWEFKCKDELSLDLVTNTIDVIIKKLYPDNLFQVNNNKIISPKQ